MKNSQILGVICAVILVIACFFHWTWYPDIGEYFSAFYSRENIYGRPGKVFMVVAAIAVALYLVPRLWAKRVNMLVCAINVAYAVKTFILFSSCYGGICPEKQPAIWVMLASALLMMVFAVIPDIKLREK